MRPPTCPVVLAALAAWGLHSLPPVWADAPADEQAARQVAERFVAAYAGKDVEAALALWSPQSRGAADYRRQLQRLFAETGPITVRRFAVASVHRDGNRTVVRFRAELDGQDRRTNQRHPALGKLHRTLVLLREPGGWKVDQEAQPELILAFQLASARDAAERQRLFAADADVDLKEVIDTLRRLSATATDRRQAQQAERLLDAAAWLAVKSGDKAELGWCYMYRGSARKPSDPATAVRDFAAALRLFREARLREGQAAALESLGLALVEQGRYPEAVAPWEEVLGLGRELGRPVAEGHALHALGVVHRNLGHFTEATRYYQAALQLARRRGDRKLEAQALNGLAGVYGRTSRYAEALQSLDEALRLYRAAGDRPGELSALVNTGTVLAEAGRAGEAAARYQDCLRLAADLKDEAIQLATLNNLGLVYRELGRTADALACLESGERLAGRLNNRSEAARLRNSIGLMHRSAGRDADALASFRTALRLYREAGDRSGEATALNNLGMMYTIEGRYAEGEQVLRDALAIAEPAGSLDGAAHCHLGLGILYAAQKRWDQAIAAYHRSAEFVEQVRVLAREPGLQTSYLAESASPYYGLAHALLERARPGDAGEAFAVSERTKARRLVDALKHGRVDVRKGMTDAERQQEQRLRDRLTALAARAEDTRRPNDPRRQQSARELGAARRDYDDFLRGLYVRHPGLQTLQARFAPVDLDELNRTLFAHDPNMAVLSYLIGDRETLLFVVTRGDRPDGPARLTAHRIAVTSADLARRVSEFREACLRPAAGAPDGGELFQTLLGPAADALASAAHLVIIPDGLLYDLPFQALRAGEDQPYLVERCAVSYAPSATALVRMAEQADRRRAAGAGRAAGCLAVGIGDFDRRERKLEASEAEAREVAALFGSEPLLGRAATRAAVQAAWGHCRYLHFATHGRLDAAAPFYSALVLSAAGGRDGGLLFARDLLEADLPAELAVLSACETARGRQVRGEGVLGMAWAWFVAGVPSTIVSQWSVSDASTEALMKEFYGRLAHGTPKAEALRQAQQALLKERPYRKYRHPFYWAPFVLIGDWGG
jgi:CHAT domain-containing protein/Tfp pilus assembly protein PilF/ketosteroid isomerase-like protein